MSAKWHFNELTSTCEEMHFSAMAFFFPIWHRERQQAERFPPWQVGWEKSCVSLVVPWHLACLPTSSCLLLPRHALSAWKSVCSGKGCKGKGKHLVSFKTWNSFFWPGIMPGSLEDELLPPNSEIQKNFKMAEVWGPKLATPKSIIIL